VDGSTSTLQTRDGREARVIVDQTIFDAQAWPLLSQARKAHDAARYQALDEKRELSFETARAFLSALGLERVVQAAAERLDLAQRNLDEIQVRFDAQLVGSNDVTRAELEVASAERELVGVRGTAQTSRLMLGYLLGVEIADSLAVPRGLLEQAARAVEPAAVTVPEATERRPDIQAERSRADALDSAAREPLARYAPDLDFTGTAWTTNESGFSGRDHDWTLGLGLTWDLFDGGEREADRSERAALARQSEFNLEALERGVDVDIETARVALESEQASLVRAELAVTAARRNASETTELYRQGLVRALEVVDANVQLFQAEVERTGVQYALALAFLDLRAAVGLDPLGNEGQP
jgi:outer membrane protein TolC